MKQLYIILEFRSFQHYALAVIDLVGPIFQILRDIFQLTFKFNFMIFITKQFHNYMNVLHNILTLSLLLYIFLKYGIEYTKLCYSQSAI